MRGWRGWLHADYPILGVLVLTPPCGRSGAAMATRWHRRPPTAWQQGVAALQATWCGLDHRSRWGGGLPDGRAPCCDLGAACGAQLGEDMGDVCRDCLGREEQLAGDLPVGEAGRDELGDLEFACTQRMPRLGLPHMAERGGEPVGGIDDGGGADRGG